MQSTLSEIDPSASFLELTLTSTLNLITTKKQYWLVPVAQAEVAHASQACVTSTNSNTHAQEIQASDDLLKVIGRHDRRSIHTSLVRIVGAPSEVGKEGERWRRGRRVRPTKGRRLTRNDMYVMCVMCVARRARSKRARSGR